MRDLTNDEWVKIQQAAGREIKFTELEHGPKFNCLLMENWKLLSIGGSYKDYDEAITKCREFFIRRNLVKMLHEFQAEEIVEIQEANLRAAEMILKKSET